MKLAKEFLCIVFRVRLKPHLDNCTAKKRRFNKGQLQDPKGSRKQVGLRIDEKIKLQRAQGGCPGTTRRRRTWQAAKSYGEPQAGIDPQISEWGNPAVEEAVTAK